VAAEQASVERAVYRLILVRPDSRAVLAIHTAEGYRLPSIRIPHGTRPAREIQKTAKSTWGLDVFVLEFLQGNDHSAVCAIAELLLPNANSELTAIALSEILGAELTESQRADLLSLLFGSMESSLSRLGWIDEAIAWVESLANRKLPSRKVIEQFNAGGAFSLIRFHTEDGSDFWLKATGRPNTHEYSVTVCLHSLSGPASPRYLPMLLGTRPEWNAWLMSGEAKPIPEIPATACDARPLLEEAVLSLARLQIAAAARSDDLLKAGAFDQRLESVSGRSEELFDYLSDAMSLQRSTKVLPVDSPRLRRIYTAFKHICHRLQDLNIPDSIVHGDMNRGNILRSERCQFIDWSEAYVGNPLVSLWHLLLLNRVEDTSERESLNHILINRYRSEWADLCGPDTFEEAFLYMPMFAAVSTLYGRGDWLNSPKRNDPHWQSYSRMLARHMDRAAHALELQEAPCL
jgi:hypothetical protein